MTFNPLHPLLALTVTHVLPLPPRMTFNPYPPPAPSVDGVLQLLHPVAVQQPHLHLRQDPATGLQRRG